MSLYLSSRGDSHAIKFDEILSGGLAPDGGLYVPVAWPSLPGGLSADQDYESLACALLWPFTGGLFDKRALRAMMARAYAPFAHSGRCPLVQIGAHEWVMELHHGPTLAFKDFAMRALAQMLEYLLMRRGRRTIILGATSGDTGSAAIDAFAGSAMVDVFILYPHGRISEIQRRQMTAHPQGNVFAVAIEGDFDDCQALVKAAFSDGALRGDLPLTAVNSINWARIAAQIVYYVAACLRLGAAKGRLEPMFFVPTGNFGDIFAGWAARRMGIPIGGLTIATNENDILVRALKTGLYAPCRTVETLSPSMDIQISSNFERALFEASGRDGAFVRLCAVSLRAEGAFTIPEAVLARLRADYRACRVDESEVLRIIRAVHDSSALWVDPHTAVGIGAARRAAPSQARPHVILATAHPAKFPDAAMRALGKKPRPPERLEKILERRERIHRLPNDPAAVMQFVAARHNGRMRT